MLNNTIMTLNQWHGPQAMSKNFNEGTSGFGVPDFIHETNCWKCDEKILVYSGSPPDDYGQVTPHDIIRQGVCYSYRYVKSAKTKQKYFWMNVCPFCDRSQMRERVTDLRKNY